MRFLIINSDTNDIVEEHNVKSIADNAVQTLNNHEVKNDRIPIYFVQPTCPTCDSEDMTKDDFDSPGWTCDHCGTHTRI